MLYLTIDDVAGLLECLPSNMPLEHSVGLDSWRGSYDELAIDDGNECDTVGELAAALRRAAEGRTYTGYKGGEYTMHLYTPVWIAAYGECEPFSVKAAPGLLRLLAEALEVRAEVEDA